MTCEEALLLISGHIDAENTPEEEAALHAHLEQCADCRRLLDAYEGIDDSIYALSEEAPQGLKKGVMYRIAQETGTKKKPRRRFIGPGTAIGAVAAVLVLLVGTGVIKLPGLSMNAKSQDAAYPQAESAAVNDGEGENDMLTFGVPLEDTQAGNELEADLFVQTQDAIEAADSGENMPTTKSAVLQGIGIKQKKFCTQLSQDKAAAVLLFDKMDASFSKMLGELSPELDELLKDAVITDEQTGEVVIETNWKTVMAIQEWLNLALPQGEDEPDDTEEITGWQRMSELDPDSGYLTAIFEKPEQIQVDIWPEKWPTDFAEGWRTETNWLLFFPEEGYEPKADDTAYLVLYPDEDAE